MIYNAEERIGVYSVAKIFSKTLHWIFREQPVNDFGIDGFIELTKFDLTSKTYIPTGKLFAVQIKSGKSYLKEKLNDYLIYRGSKKHINYWLNYSIPVILIIYDKDTDQAFWQEVNHTTILFTVKSFKLTIPLRNKIGEQSSEKLANLTFYKNTYEYKLWQLKTSIKEVNLLIKQRLYMYVEIEHSNCFEDFNIKLIISEENCEDCSAIINRLAENNSSRFEYTFLLSSDSSLKEAINDTIPWADLFLKDYHFTDNLLSSNIFKEIMDYNQEDFSEDIIRLNEKNDFLNLATYLSDSYAFKLNIKPNKISYAFLELETFFNKTPIVKQGTFF